MEPITTIEEAFEAVRRVGWNLMFVPEALKTPELCIIAVKNNRWALEYVPNQKSFLTTYPEFLPIYFRNTLKEDQDPNLISLLIQTTNNDIIDEIGNLINLNLIQGKDLPFLIGCKKPTITNFLNENFKASK
jgi:DNA replication protein DnaD